MAKKAKKYCVLYVLIEGLIIMEHSKRLTNMDAKMIQRQVILFFDTLQITVPVSAVFNENNTTASNASYYYILKGVHSNLFYVLILVFR